MKILLEALSIFNNHNEENSPLSIINLNALQYSIRCLGLLVGMHEKRLQMFFDKANALNKINQHVKQYMNKRNIFNLSKTLIKQSKLIQKNSKHIFAKEMHQNLPFAAKQISSLNRFTQASLCYDQAIKINQNYFEALNNKGSKSFKYYREQFYLYSIAQENVDELQIYEEAILCYDQSIKYNSTQSEAFNNKEISVSYSKHKLSIQKLKKYEEAVQCYEQSISINPKFSEAFYNKGFQSITRIGFKIIFHHKRIVYNLDKYEDAILCFDQVVKFNQVNCEALNNKGLALNFFKLHKMKVNKLSRYEEAIQCFNKAKIPNEKFSEAYNNKGAALNFIQRKICYHV